VGSHLQELVVFAVDIKLSLISSFCMHNYKILFLSLCCFFLANCSSNESVLDPVDVDLAREESKKEEVPLSKQTILAVPELREEELLVNAMNAYDRGLFSMALTRWKELRDGYPRSYYSALAELKIADSQFQLADYASAIVSYEEFLRLHPKHEAEPYIRFQIGECNLNRFRGAAHDALPLKTAMQQYRNLFQDFPLDEYGIRARRRYQSAEELLLEQEAQVVRFYLRAERFQAAMNRVEELKINYSGKPIINELISEVEAQSGQKLLPLTPTKKQQQELIPVTPKLFLQKEN
jgi:outer membrane protein assembly factor BamD